MTEDTYVLSHMLPIKWSPDENDYETDKQAKRTEVWLQKIADIFGEHLLRWYAGHYHMTCAGERYEIVYNEIKKLEQREIFVIWNKNDVNIFKGEKSDS